MPGQGCLCDILMMWCCVRVMFVFSSDVFLDAQTRCVHESSAIVTLHINVLCMTHVIITQDNDAVVFCVTSLILERRHTV